MQELIKSFLINELTVTIPYDLLVKLVSIRGSTTIAILTVPLMGGKKWGKAIKFFYFYFFSKGC